MPYNTQISRKQMDLKKKLKVTFHGEPGLDMGGLTKEWFSLLIRQIFHEDYGKWTSKRKEGFRISDIGFVCPFSSSSFSSSLAFSLLPSEKGLKAVGAVIDFSL